jgi:hypothetical protein
MARSRRGSGSSKDSGGSSRSGSNAGSFDIRGSVRSDAERSNSAEEERSLQAQVAAVAALHKIGQHDEADALQREQLQRSVRLAHKKSRRSLLDDYDQLPVTEDAAAGAKGAAGKADDDAGLPAAGSASEDDDYGDLPSAGSPDDASPSTARRTLGKAFSKRVLALSAAAEADAYGELPDTEDGEEKKAPTKFIVIEHIAPLRPIGDLNALKQVESAINRELASIDDQIADARRGGRVPENPGDVNNYKIKANAVLKIIEQRRHMLAHLVDAFNKAFPERTDERIRNALIQFVLNPGSQMPDDLTQGEQAKLQQALQSLLPLMEKAQQFATHNEGIYDAWRQASKGTDPLKQPNTFTQPIVEWTMMAEQLKFLAEHAAPQEPRLAYQFLVFENSLASSGMNIVNQSFGDETADKLKQEMGRLSEELRELKRAERDARRAGRDFERLHEIRSNLSSRLQVLDATMIFLRRECPVFAMRDELKATEAKLAQAAPESDDGAGVAPPAPRRQLARGASSIFALAFVEKEVSPPKHRRQPKHRARVRSRGHGRRGRRLASAHGASAAAPKSSDIKQENFAAIAGAIATEYRTVRDEVAKVRTKVDRALNRTAPVAVFNALDAFRQATLDVAASPAAADSADIPKKIGHLAGARVIAEDAKRKLQNVWDIVATDPAKFAEPRSLLAQFNSKRTDINHCVVPDADAWGGEEQYRAAQRKCQDEVSALLAKLSPGEREQLKGYKTKLMRIRLMIEFIEQWQDRSYQSIKQLEAKIAPLHEGDVAARVEYGRPILIDESPVATDADAETIRGTNTDDEQYAALPDAARSAAATFVRTTTQRTLDASAVMTATAGAGAGTADMGDYDEIPDGARSPGGDSDDEDDGLPIADARDEAATGTDPYAAARANYGAILFPAKVPEGETVAAAGPDTAAAHATDSTASSDDEVDTEEELIEEACVALNIPCVLSNDDALEIIAEQQAQAAAAAQQAAAGMRKHAQHRQGVAAPDSSSGDETSADSDSPDTATASEQHKRSLAPGRRLRSASDSEIMSLEIPDEPRPATVHGRKLAARTPSHSSITSSSSEDWARGLTAGATSSSSSSSTSKRRRRTGRRAVPAGSGTKQTRHEQHAASPENVDPVLKRQDDEEILLKLKQDLKNIIDDTEDTLLEKARKFFPKYADYRNRYMYHYRTYHQAVKYPGDAFAYGFNVGDGQEPQLFAGLEKNNTVNASRLQGLLDHFFAGNEQASAFPDKIEVYRLGREAFAKSAEKATKRLNREARLGYDKVVITERMLQGARVEEVFQEKCNTQAHQEGKKRVQPESALQIAAFRGNRGVLRTILKVNDAMVSQYPDPATAPADFAPERARDDIAISKAHLESALIFAARGGHKKTMKDIIRLANGGGYPNIPKITNEHIQQALRQAVETDQADIVEAILHEPEFHVEDDVAVVAAPAISGVVYAKGPSSTPASAAKPSASSDRSPRGGRRVTVAPTDDASDSSDDDIDTGARAAQPAATAASVPAPAAAPTVSAPIPQYLIDVDNKALALAVETGNQEIQQHLLRVLARRMIGSDGRGVANPDKVGLAKGNKDDDVTKLHTAVAKGLKNAICERLLQIINEPNVSMDALEGIFNAVGNTQHFLNETRKVGPFRLFGGTPKGGHTKSNQQIIKALQARVIERMKESDDVLEDVAPASETTDSPSKAHQFVEALFDVDIKSPHKAAYDEICEQGVPHEHDSSSDVNLP